MLKDDRLYGKFVLDLPDHPKIMPLSDAAFRCLIEATLWSRKHLTNGLLPRSFAIVRWSFDVLQELTTNHPTNPSLIVCDEGWLIHDFAEHQTTKEEVEAKREVRKIAGRKGGIASGRSRREANAKQTLKQTRSKTKPETETETETKENSYVSSGSSSVGRAKRGTRINPDWMPTQSVIDAIKDETGATKDELAYQHRKFVDYWADKAGKDATKLSWDGTWRNWMRTAHQRGEIGKTAAAGKPSKLRVLADLAAEVRAMENPNGKALEA